MRFQRFAHSGPKICLQGPKILGSLRRENDGVTHFGYIIARFGNSSMIISRLIPLCITVNVYIRRRMK